MEKAGKPTHRETCRAVARFLLLQDWADVACWEMGVGGHQLDVIAVTGATSAAKEALRVSQYERRMERVRTHGGRSPDRRPKVVIPRVQVVEVKVSRSDLQAGLRRNQLQEYADDLAIRGTHFALALWEDALQRHPTPAGYWREADTLSALTDLGELGVPEEWGVFRISRSMGRDRTIYVTPIRRAKRLRPPPDLTHRLGLAEMMARSLAYRVLGDTSPERGNA